jgi:transglutaminase-like putative cysteine protease
VVGLNPPDFHAAFEAYLNDRWYLFDPTRLVSLQDFVRVGTGHDAADVAFATIFGAVEMSHMELFIHEQSGAARQSDLRPISTIVE